MGRLDAFKTPKFTERTIDGFGTVRIRQLKTGEMLKCMAGDDKQMRLKQITLASVYDPPADGNPAAIGTATFTSVEEMDAIDWSLFDQLSDAAIEVNKINRKAAEKNSGTPPSSK